MDLFFKLAIGPFEEQEPEGFKERIIERFGGNAQAAVSYLKGMLRMGPDLEIEATIAELQDDPGYAVYTASEEAGT